MGIVSLVFFTVLSIPVYAISFDMSVETFQEISTCPTIMKDTPPLDYQDIPIFITNFYDYPDTYKLSLQLPEGWTGFIDPDFFVNSGETLQVQPFWITVPNVDAGVYPVTIKAKSGQTGDEIEKTINIKVLACHKVEINIEEDYKEVCKEEAKDVVYDINIYNKGKSPETFDIELFYNNEKVDWLVTSAPKITISDNDVATIKATVTIPENLEGLQKFDIKVTSTDSYAEDKESFQLNIKDCYNFDVNLQPKETGACLGEYADYYLTITNFGKEDTFRIFAPNWVTIMENITIPENSKKEIPFKVKPEMKGKVSFTITVTPSSDISILKNVTGIVNVNECTGVAVVAALTEKTVCSGDVAEFDIMIKNTGSISSKINIVTDFGTLNKNQIVLNPKEMEIIKLKVDTKSFVGERVVTVSASVNGEAADQTLIRIISENCYSAELKLTPENVTSCPCETVKFTSEVKNTGKLKDNYTLKFGDVLEHFALEPGETKTFTHEFSIACDAVESQKVAATLSSAHVHVSDNSLVNIKPKEQCYGSEISEGGRIEVEILKSKAVPIKIKNTGEKEDTYKFSIEAPNWVFLQPDTVTLSPGEEKEVFLYISPIFGTELGEYETTVTVKSDYIESSTEFIIDVVSETAKPGIYPEGNKTVVITPPGKEVVLNASINKTEADITGETVAISESTKLIIVGVLTMLIVIVLIIRFVTLIK
jgi:uncharacterized membrane protein